MLWRNYVSIEDDCPLSPTSRPDVPSVREQTSLFMF
jgi:hypothetical protein